MDAIQVAKEILESYDCANIRENPNIGAENGFWHIGGKRGDKTLIFFAEEHLNWGKDQATGFGDKNWCDSRFPWRIVQFKYRKEIKTEGKYKPTHSVMISSCGNRAFIVPFEIIKNADRSMIQMEGDVPRWINVKCCTDSCHFLVRKGDKWVKDSSNVWLPEQSVPLDEDEFVSSL